MCDEAFFEDAFEKRSLDRRIRAVDRGVRHYPKCVYTSAQSCKGNTDSTILNLIFG
jgi:hypothetical protein